MDENVVTVSNLLLNFGNWELGFLPKKGEREWRFGVTFEGRLSGPCGLGNCVFWGPIDEMTQILIN